MIGLKAVDLKKQKIDTLIVPVCEDKKIHDDRIINAIIKKALSLKEFEAEKGDELTLYDLKDLNTKRVIFVGLGKLKKIDPETLRAFCGAIVKRCIKVDLEVIWVAVPAAHKLKMEMPATVAALMEGACLGNHLFDKYKKEKKRKPLKQINFLVKPDALGKLRRITPKVSTICAGTILAREWISTPSNEKTPEQFTRLIVSQARKHGLKTRVLREKDLKQHKFGALLAVAAGSRSKPSMVILEHKHPSAQKTLALVGKGVTFDSGGLNIKTGGSMASMKSDMSGAAVVAATLITLARLKTKSHVIGAIPIVENMPSGKAIRPGDIVRSYAGKTIEIGNTDAEGRLILIDAMSYVVNKYKPQMMIDLATLTGACVVALGEKIAGVFAQDDELAKLIISSGNKTHERCWQMPMPDDYKELLKSDFADLNNMPSSRWGGAITAALFLSEFRGDTRWAHIDIAGPAYIKKGDSYCGPGGTGFGVRLLCDLIEQL
ncbi:MAG: leucyl aminopeptidase [Desulfobacterales bacterium]|nr:leucyl aminopeptidase [Desulfobacterales bacterium]